VSILFCIQLRGFQIGSNNSIGFPDGSLSVQQISNIVAPLCVTAVKGMKRINQIFLFIYSVFATIVLILALLFYLKDRNATKAFDVISAQQIKIVEPDGTLRMIISNSKKLPGVIVHGKEVEKVDRPQAGMLFFNDEASENGGLIFSGSKNEKGEVINSGVSLSFDRYGGKQEVNLIGVNDKDVKFAGLAISDSRPGEKFTPTRIWVGRNDDGSSEMALMDSSGRKRIVLKVLQNGVSSLNFLDEKGNVLNSFKPEEKRH
jgi:hypothetical protein